MLIIESNKNNYVDSDNILNVIIKWANKSGGQPNTQMVVLDNSHERMRGMLAFDSLHQRVQLPLCFRAECAKVRAKRAEI